MTRRSSDTPRSASCCWISGSPWNAGSSAAAGAAPGACWRRQQSSGSSCPPVMLMGVCRPVRIDVCDSS